MISTATERAEEILIDRRHFVADPEAWERFMKALESPPAPVEALVALFGDPDL